MRFLSRKFLLAVAVIALVVFNKVLKLGLDIDGQAIKTILTAAIAYIVAEGTRDVVIELKKK